MKGRLALAALLIVGMGTAAAGIATGDTRTGPDSAVTPPGTVAVELDEWRIDTGKNTVPAGRVTFEESNAGEEEHDLLVVQTDAPPDELPMGLEGVSPEAAGEVVLGETHEDHGGHGAAGGDGSSPSAGTHGHGPDASDDHERHLHPGEERRRTVSLQPGRYVLICPVPGHYERGQRTAITVR